MTVDTGYQASTAIIFPLGFTDKIERNIGSAIYPGRLTVSGTTNYDAVPADCLNPVTGIAGFEFANGAYQPVNIRTAWAVGAVAPICNCPGKPVFSPSGIPKGFKVSKGDILIPWGTAGQLAPAIEIDGGYAVKIPFSKSTSEFDTNIDLPAGVLAKGARLNVTTNAGSSTCSVGILSTQPSGSATGFLATESCANAGLVPHVIEDAAGTGQTLGSFLNAGTIKSADASAKYIAVPKSYLVASGTQRVTYTTSNHTIAGWIYINIESPGIAPVGRAKYDVDATSADSDIHWESDI